MNKTEVILLLEKNKDLRGIKHWEKAGIKGMDSYGIGMVKLKALAKQIGKNHNLALELWEENNFECKVISTLVDEAKKITRAQIENQVGDVNFWMLSYSYCNNLLPKVAGLKEITEDWISETDDLKRRCGFLLIYQIAKNDKNLPDDYFSPLIDRIEKEIQREENFVKDAMNVALWMIGQRSAILNQKALEAAKKIGKVEVDYGDNSCQAMDVAAHLSSERILKKFKT